jgi:hypothetical protein
MMEKSAKQIFCITASSCSPVECSYPANPATARAFVNAARISTNGFLFSPYN